MSETVHQLWLASAGTGKTYKLTGHYLRRLLRGDDPRRILATTFTRKAAGEILERVLQRLLDAARGGDELESLGALVPERHLDAKQCRGLLLRVLQELDRFRISTLDSFFLQLAQTMSFELDLPLGWRIADEVEDQDLTMEAVKRLLDEYPPEELAPLMRELQRSGATRSVSGTLERVIQKARAPFRESEREAWERPTVDGPDRSENIPGLVEALLALPIPLTKAKKKNSLWDKGVTAIAQHASAEAWGEVLKHGLIGKIDDVDPSYSKVAIGDEWLEVLRPLKAIAGRALLAELRTRNVATHDLLERFESGYRAVKRERGVLRFEDLPELLVPTDGTDDETSSIDMAYWLDGQLDHVLLDEFQDTAPAQWRVLRGLCEELMADGTGERSFFCVGDLKQSIYGWRSAEPRLLAGMSQYAVLTPETMTRSFRSSQVILDTVHHVFCGIDQSPVFNGDERAAYQRAATEFLEDYAKHDTARVGLPGAAFVIEARPVDEEDATDDDERAVIERTVERIQLIRRTQPDWRVGVLLRSRKLIGRIQSALAEVHLPASGEGGNPLTDSAAVLHAISLVQLADHPGDSAAEFHLRHSPFWGGLGFDAAATRADASRSLRERMLAEGMGPFFAALLALVEDDAQYGEWDARRFGQLVDLAFAFDLRTAPRLDLFTNILRATRVEDPASAGIQVLTIHASKGLGFDAVLLPELERDLRPKPGDVLYHRPCPTGAIKAATTYPGKKVLELDPELNDLYTNYLERDFREALCLLYVAMTRAKQHLELVLHAPRKSSRTPAFSYSALIRAALDVGESDESGVLWKHAESADWSSIERSMPVPVTSTGSGLDRAARELVFAERAAEGHLDHHSPTERAAGSRVKGSALFKGDARARRYGILVHRFFEELEWANEFEHTDEQLLELAKRLDPDAGLARAALSAFRGALSDDEKCVRLTRASYPQELFIDLEVRREASFALILPDDDGVNRFWRGTIDRLVLVREGDRVTSADVIDFKTGEETDASRASHQPQLDAYRRAVSVMFDLDPAQVACSTLHVAAAGPVPVS